MIFKFREIYVIASCGFTWKWFVAVYRDDTKPKAVEALVIAYIPQLGIIQTGDKN